MENQRIMGIINTSPEKRYRNFISTIADREEVWLLRNENGYATIDIEDKVCLILYPEKEFALHFSNEAEKEEIEMISVHDFLERCKSLINQEEIMFAIFPTDKNCYISPVETVYYDLLEELDRIE